MWEDGLDREKPWVFKVINPEYKDDEKEHTILLRMKMTIVNVVSKEIMEEIKLKESEEQESELILSIVNQKKGLVEHFNDIIDDLKNELRPIFTLDEDFEGWINILKRDFNNEANIDRFLISLMLNGLEEKLTNFINNYWNVTYKRTFVPELFITQHSSGGIDKNEFISTIGYFKSKYVPNDQLNYEVLFEGDEMSLEFSEKDVESEDSIRKIDVSESNLKNTKQVRSSEVTEFENSSNSKSKDDQHIIKVGESESSSEKNSESKDSTSKNSSDSDEDITPIKSEKVNDRDIKKSGMAGKSSISKDKKKITDTKPSEESNSSNSKSPRTKSPESLQTNSPKSGKILKPEEIRSERSKDKNLIPRDQHSESSRTSSERDNTTSRKQQKIESTSKPLKSPKSSNISISAQKELREQKGTNQQQKIKRPSELDSSITSDSETTSNTSGKKQGKSNVKIKKIKRRRIVVV